MRGARAWATALLLAAQAVAAAAASGGEAAFETLAPGVHLHRGALEEWGADHADDVANSALVLGTRCAALIDSGGSAAAAERLLAALRRTTSLPLCYVVNTHAHPDHVLGNAVFAALEPRPQFVGHAKLAAALAARGPAYRNALARDFGAAAATAAPIVPPTLTVRPGERLTLELGGRQLLLDAWPTAHTDADLSVLDATSGALFLGDLLFVGHTPVLDGKLAGWLAVLDRLAAMPGVRIAVPGHGAPQRQWPAALAAERAYLQRLQADVRQALKDGWTLAQAVERIAPDRPGWALLEVFHKRNVTAAYAELEWE